MTLLEHLVEMIRARRGARGHRRFFAADDDDAEAGGGEADGGGERAKPTPHARPTPRRRRAALGDVRAHARAHRRRARRQRGRAARARAPEGAAATIARSLFEHLVYASRVQLSDITREVAELRRGLAALETERQLIEREERAAFAADQARREAAAEAREHGPCAATIARARTHDAKFEEQGDDAPPSEPAPGARRRARRRRHDAALLGEISAAAHPQAARGGPTPRCSVRFGRRARRRRPWAAAAGAASSSRRCARAAATSATACHGRGDGAERRGRVVRPAAEKTLRARAEILARMLGQSRRRVLVCPRSRRSCSSTPTRARRSRGSAGISARASRRARAWLEGDGAAGAHDDAAETMAAHAAAQEGLEALHAFVADVRSARDKLEKRAADAARARIEAREEHHVHEAAVESRPPMPRAGPPAGCGSAPPCSRRSAPRSSRPRAGRRPRRGARARARARLVAVEPHAQPRLGARARRTQALRAAARARARA